MKPFVYLFLLLFGCSAYGQNLSVNQLKEDFDYLRRALEEGHGGLYRHHSKYEIDNLFDQYRRELRQL